MQISTIFYFEYAFYADNVLDMSTDARQYSITRLPGDDWEIRFTKQVVRNIAHYKDELRLTTEQLAERCSEAYGEPGKVKGSTLNGLFAGKRKSIGAAEIMIFAAALGVPPVMLMLPIGLEETVEARPGYFAPIGRATLGFNGLEAWRGFHEPTRTGPADERLVSYVFSAWKAEDDFHETLSATIRTYIRDFDSAFDVALIIAIQRLKNAVKVLQTARMELRREGIAPEDLDAPFQWADEVADEDVSLEFVGRVAASYPRLGDDWNEPPA